MKKTPPLLSIIIPTYNGEKYLSSSLSSIVSQSSFPQMKESIECILIDDGSTDKTLSIAQSFSDSLNLNIIKNNKPSKGWVSNTNFAIKQTSGDYICFLHQDDLWLDNRLDVFKQALKKFPDFNFFISQARYINKEGTTLQKWKCPFPNKFCILDKKEFLSKYIIQSFMAIVTPIFKKTALEKTGLLDDTLWYTADWDFWLRMGENFSPVYYPHPTGGFRIHKESQTVKRSFDNVDFRNQLDIVALRHISLLNVDEKTRSQLKQYSLFSNLVNVTLATAFHTHWAKGFSLFLPFLKLGPVGWYKYIYGSRIYDRITARFKL